MELLLAGVPGIWHGLGRTGRRLGNGEMRLQQLPPRAIGRRDHVELIEPGVRTTRKHEGVADVAVDSLLPADSPRLDGQQAVHVRDLVAVETALPPILVHRETMRVVDGMHRLLAAQLRGARTIPVRYVDGNDNGLFVLSVEANLSHGLRLSVADREAAATRILKAYPHWSDRAIATVTGLAAKKVREIRRCASSDLPQLHARVGQDGRVRPVNSAEGRRLASRVIAARPDASLREVARIAGISPGTVRDVRRRMSRGDDPVTKRQRSRPEAPATARSADQSPTALVTRDAITILENLRRDPALRFSDTGRTLLRWMHMKVVETDGLSDKVGAVPAHCADQVAELALACAEEWRNFAQSVERRNGDSA